MKKIGQFYFDSYSQVSRSNVWDLSEAMKKQNQNISFNAG